MPATDGAPLGILGGVFDPVHEGHLAVAAAARDFLGLERLLLVPSGTPPHKRSVTASARHRLAMLKAAVRSRPGLQIYDKEIRRRGYSYTVDTLRELSRIHPGRPLYFIVGSDNLREIETWYRYREILAMVTLCVTHRPRFRVAVPPALKGARILLFPSPESPASSTLVRKCLAKGESCRGLVAPAVASYIKRHGLYRLIK